MSYSSTTQKQIQGENNKVLQDQKGFKLSYIIGTQYLLNSPIQTFIDPSNSRGIFILGAATKFPSIS